MILEAYKQTEPLPMRYGSRDDARSTVMSFGSTPEQQRENISRMLQQRDRQYHRSMQQEQMRLYQVQRWQQQGPLIEIGPSNGPLHTMGSPHGSVREPVECSAAALVAQGLGKRKGDKGIEAVEAKRARR